MTQGIKTVNVYGLKMSSLEEMMFSKYIRNNGIAMNTKTKDERLAIALEWLGSFLKGPGSFYEGVDPESELFICLHLLQNGVFHFDSLEDSDYIQVRTHLDRLGIQHELKFGNRISLHLKEAHKTSYL